MTKNPKDMTQAEMEALPVGPAVRHRRPLTEEEEEDHRRGLRGKYVEWVEPRQVMVRGHDNGDLIGFTDGDGLKWTVGQWVDGQWFKEPALF